MRRFANELYVLGGRKYPRLTAAHEQLKTIHVKSKQASPSSDKALAGAITTNRWIRNPSGTHTLREIRRCVYNERFIKTDIRTAPRTGGKLGNSELSISRYSIARTWAPARNSITITPSPTGLTYRCDTVHPVETQRPAKKMGAGSINRREASA